MKKAALIFSIITAFVYLGTTKFQDMRKIDNLTGKKYNFLTITSEVYYKMLNCGYRRPHVMCKCDCGETKECDAYHVLNSKVISCGCKWGGRTTHGLSKHRLYAVWEGIKARCYNPNYNQYCDYGGRGIKMCDEWRYDAESFIRWSMENGWKKGLTIERENNDGNYEPSNCKYATWKEQGKNKRSNRYLTCNGKTMTIGEWKIELGCSEAVIRNRLKNPKWTVEQALTIKPQIGRNQYSKI